MKKVYLFIAIASLAVTHAFGQCNINNATSCQCLDGTTDCNLLPNITLADEPLLVAGSNGVIEYSQSGNGAENGRLRVSVSTPNIGRGPLTILSNQIFICGTDTFTTNPGTCPNGSAPRQLITQRVYHKNGNVMSYSDRPAGSMTYHPTHNHMHVDDWGTYDLRIRDTSVANPLLWPIVGTGAKLGFCLMDYGTCSYYNGHCEDSAGNVLLNANFPNFGLGGGNYNCSPTMQGISSGYTDIYYQQLDGMYITLPPTTCNGDYYIVVNIDPHNYFLEEKEDDNVIAIPYTLTKQIPAGTGSATITVSGNATGLCEGDSLVLTANSGSAYLWSTNATSQSITIKQQGTYSVQVTSQCGMATSSPLNISVIPSHINNASDASVCSGNEITLNASATGVISWFSDTGSAPIFNGNSYTFTPGSTTTLLIQSNDTVFGISGSVGPADNTIGSGSNYSNDQHQIFSVFKPIVLKTVKVYAGSSKNRTIELRNSNGVVLQSKVVNINSGTQTVDLNFEIAPGTDYQLGWLNGSQPDLYRNSSGASYPYTLSSLVTVTGNSANDPVRWYAYYDWKVEEKPVICSSAKDTVLAIVNTIPVVNITPINAQYFDTEPSVALTGTPAGGTFSGPGVSSGSFNPASAGVGGPYTITYTYQDSVTGCSATSSMQVSVIEDQSSGMATIDGIKSAAIFPNPNNGNFSLIINSEASRKLSFTVSNELGQKIYEAKNVSINQGHHKHDVDLGTVAPGIYIFTVASGKTAQSYRVIVK